MFSVFVPVFELLEKLLVVASIEAPFTFLQEPIKTLLLDAVKFPHMPLGLVPEILDPVDVVLLVSKQFRVVDTLVMKIRYIQSIVRSEGIRINDAIWPDFFLDNRQQRFCFCIRDDGGINLAATL